MSGDLTSSRYGNVMNIPSRDRHCNWQTGERASMENRRAVSLHGGTASRAQGEDHSSLEIDSSSGKLMFPEVS